MTSDDRPQDPRRDVENGEYQCSHCGGGASNLIGEEHIWKCSNILPVTQIEALITDLRQDAIDCGDMDTERMTEAYANGVSAGLNYTADELESRVNDHD
jgi:hypothetical protein